MAFVLYLLYLLCVLHGQPISAASVYSICYQAQHAPSVDPFTHAICSQVRLPVLPGPPVPSSYAQR